MRRAFCGILTLVVSTLVVVGAPSEVAPAQAGGIGSVTSDYTLLRAKPHGFVIGQAYRNTIVVVQQEPIEGYQWARIDGAFQDCAWIYQGAVSSTSDIADECRHDGRDISEATFARFIALGGDTAANPDNGTDGLPAHINISLPNCTIKDAANTAAFGNVNAIEGGSETPEDFLFTVPDGHPVMWRYLTRDYRWFMLRDPSGGPTDGVGNPSWYFVQAQCVAVDQPNSNRYIP